jgi:hypothetical protein
MPTPEPGPLAASDLARLDSTLLPALERHHLRLLAHCLRTFQQIAGRRSGPLPPSSALDHWLDGQLAIAADPGFRQAFRRQLDGAGLQLARLAAGLGRDPLALDLEDLIGWAEAEARERIRAAPHRPPG